MRTNTNNSLLMELLAVSIIILTAGVGSSLSSTDTRLIRRERSITGRSSSFWGDWGQWSGCSRSCGGGVASQVRPCLRRRRSGAVGMGHHCVGLYRQYKQCNTKPCPNGSKDFRTEQCESYNNIPFMGQLYEWYAFVKEPMVCELHCRAKGYRFYAKHSDKVVDGTTCRTGETDVCVNGMCKKVGCDGVLSSGLEYDKCGVCDGHNTACEVHTGTFNKVTMSVGYNDIVTIPVGAMYINITAAKSMNYLALADTNGETYINGNWHIDTNGNYPAAGTMFQYKRASVTAGSGQQLIAEGPTDKDLIVQLIFQKTNPGVEYEYVIPTETLPTTVKPTTTTETDAPLTTSLPKNKHEEIDSNPSRTTSTNQQNSRSHKKKKGNRKGQQPRTSTGSPAVASPVKPKNNKQKQDDIGLTSPVLPPNLGPNARTPIDSGGLWPNGNKPKINTQTSNTPVPDAQKVTEMPDSTTEQTTQESNRRHHHFSNDDTPIDVQAEESKAAAAVLSENTKTIDETKTVQEIVPSPSGVVESGSSQQEVDKTKDKNIDPPFVDYSETTPKPIKADDASANGDASPTVGSKITPKNTYKSEKVSTTEKTFFNRKTSTSERPSRNSDRLASERIPPSTLEDRLGSNGNNPEEAEPSPATPDHNALNIADSNSKESSHGTSRSSGNPYYPNHEDSLPSGLLPNGKPKVINPYKPGFMIPNTQARDGNPYRSGNGQTDALSEENPQRIPETQGYQQNGGYPQSSGYQPNGGRPQNSGYQPNGGYQQNGGTQTGGYQQNGGYRPNPNSGFPQSGSTQNGGYQPNGGYRPNPKVGFPQSGSTQNGGYQPNGGYRPNPNGGFPQSGSTHNGGYQQNGGYRPNPNGGIPQSGSTQNGGYQTSGSQNGYQPNGGSQIGGYQPNGRFPQNGGYQPSGGGSQNGYQPNGGGSQNGYQPNGGGSRNGYQPNSGGSQNGYQPNVGSQQGGGRYNHNPSNTDAGSGLPYGGSPNGGAFPSSNRGPSTDDTTTGSPDGEQERQEMPVVNPLKTGNVGTEDATYLWQEVGLSDCSVTCAGGTQHKVVICFNLENANEAEDSYCDERYKPPTKTIICNTQPCPAMWEVGMWSQCSRTCGRGMQMRQVICKQKKSASLTTIVDMSNCDASKIPDKVQECSMARCTMWKTGRWQTCSAQCGDGVQSRDITCIDDNMNPVDVSGCDPNSRPLESIACTGPPCDTKWFIGDWPRQCSRECGGGQMARVTVCTTVGLHGDMGSGQCDVSLKPREVKACNSQLCGAKWFASEWGQCSVECGVGIQARDVMCISQNIPKRILDDSACPARLKPAEEQRCELTSCSPMWLKTEWSTCSKTCGTGSQTREVKCMSHNMQASNECDESKRPDTQQECNKLRCALNTQPSSTKCTDRYTYCDKVAQARLCSYAFYKKYCCHSCFGRNR